MPVRFDEIGYNEQIYEVFTDTDIDNAITDIESNNYMGIINIMADITLDSTLIFNDASAAYIINGNGHTITSNGDNIILDIDNALKIIIKNCKFDCSGFTTAGKNCIDIDEASDNEIYIENCYFYDDGNVADFIDSTSNNIHIINNIFENGRRQANISGTDCIITGNYISGSAINGFNFSGNRNILSSNIFINAQRVVYCTSAEHIIISNNIISGASDITSGGLIYLSSCSFCQILNNIISDCSATTDGRAIALLNSHYCTINGNIIENVDSTIATSWGRIKISNADQTIICHNLIRDCTNSGAGSAIGLEILNTCDRCITHNNILMSNDTNLSDAGTNSDTDHNITA